MKKMRTYDELVKAMFEASAKEDKEAVNSILAEMHESVVEDVQEHFDGIVEASDAAVLAQRGHRQLTSTEREWYNKLIEACKENNPKDAVLKVITDDVMPTTIVEDVYRDLRAEHPLLSAINFQYVGYVTKWVLNAHEGKKAAWGPITATIVTEITSALKVVDVHQNKLSAFAIIEKGMLEMGPAFLDAYIREILKEAIIEGLEEAIIKGTGKDMPTGMVKDIHEGVEFNSVTGYPDKAKTVVKTLTPKEYGALVAKLAKTEKGKTRKVNKVAFICNQNDYLTKIMPATTLLGGNGYVGNLFPFATEVIIANCLADGEAVLALPEEYFLGMGGSKDGVIEYSDEYKFLEDQRAFKIKQYGTGIMADNTCALFLNITALEPATLEVKTIAPAPGK